MAEITLRSWENKYAERLAYLGNNINIFNNLTDSFPNPYTIEKAKIYIKSTRNVRGLAQAIIWNNQIVGNIAVYQQEDIYRANGRIAYFLGIDYWNQGIMTKAVKSMTTKCFNENPEITRIFADPFESNIGSRKALEKNGYELEGILRKNAIKNGKYNNSYVYSKLKDTV
jgi:ribosomal-protein-alanine N-acetyltransferase